MSETLDPVGTDVDQHGLAQQLLAQAKEQGIELVGPDGLLNRLRKNVLETALEAEMEEHLGYEMHDVGGHGRSGRWRSVTGEMVEWQNRRLDPDLPGGVH